MTVVSKDQDLTRKMLYGYCHGTQEVHGLKEDPVRVNLFYPNLNTNLSISAVPEGLVPEGPGSARSEGRRPCSGAPPSARVSMGAVRVVERDLALVLGVPGLDLGVRGTNIIGLNIGDSWTGWPCSSKSRGVGRGA